MSLLLICKTIGEYFEIFVTIILEFLAKHNFKHISLFIIFIYKFKKIFFCWRRVLADNKRGNCSNLLSRVRLSLQG